MIHKQRLHVNIEPLDETPLELRNCSKEQIKNTNTVLLFAD